MGELTDRELLERAAKAAGMIPPPAGMTVGEGGPMSKGGLIFAGNGQCIDWNPLVSDGDAHRLAVKLNFSIQRLPNKVGICQFAGEGGYLGGWTEFSIVESDEAVTRRAIVRAAAAIGEGM